MLEESQKTPLGEGVDQRRYPRWEINNCVLFRPENEERARMGSTKDLNCAGACIASKEDLSLDDKIQVTLYLTDKITVDLEAMVVWMSHVNEENRFGVEFIDPPGDAEELIFEHAFSLNKDKIVNDWFKGWDN